MTRARIVGKVIALCVAATALALIPACGYALAAGAGAGAGYAVGRNQDK